MSTGEILLELSQSMSMGDILLEELNGSISLSSSLIALRASASSSFVIIDTIFCKG